MHRLQWAFIFQTFGMRPVQAFQIERVFDPMTRPDFRQVDQADGGSVVPEHRISQMKIAVNPVNRSPGTPTSDEVHPVHASHPEGLDPTLLLRQFVFQDASRSLVQPAFPIISSLGTIDRNPGHAGMHRSARTGGP